MIDFKFLKYLIYCNERNYFSAESILIVLLVIYIYTLTYQNYSNRPKFPFTFSHIYLLIKESTH